MTDRIAAAFEAARGEGRAALMPYLMGGFPDHDTSLVVAQAYADAGADLVELGVPFSDPLADGPVIHAAATRALERGATLESTLELCERIAARVPVVPMAYANMILTHGPERFARLLADAGAVGAIVPDLGPDEGGEIAEELRAAGLALVPLVAPTTRPARRARIGAEAEGFVYLVSDTRTTGERERMPAALRELIGSVQAVARVPVAVGFGIGTPEQAAEVGTIADGVIIGTRLVRAVAESKTSAEAAASVSSFIRECRDRLTAGGGDGAGADGPRGRGV
ncbi:MAG: tryptophan synthase subunit alpha [Solirubrobacterales bacterium]|nr:tryptophan synthase subunit alpha [Solirubrobacterales bacterium]